MIVPSGMTEGEVCQAIQAAIDRLSPTLSFGYHQREDIEQQAWVYALELLKKEVYDISKPLVAFVLSHVRNRTLNHIRDTVHRSDPPCRLCHLALEGGTGHPDGRICPAYAAWKRRNETKSRLMTLGPIDSCEDPHLAEPSPYEETHAKEMLSAIDQHLPLHLRADYLRLRDGQKIGATRRKHVQDYVKLILASGSFV